MSRPDFNRYAARDGKLYEIVRRDPEETREICIERIADGRAHLAVRMAAELNAAHAHGWIAFGSRLRGMLGL